MTPPSPDNRDARYFVESASRSLELLFYVARRREPVTLGDLVKGLGWTKPMVYRLIRTLQSHDAIRKSGDGYILGPALIELGQAALASMAVPEVARPHMEALNSRHRVSSVNLGILEASEVLYLDHVEGDHVVVVRVAIGSRLPAHLTSLGQVLLAALPADEVEERLAKVKFDKNGPRAVASMTELHERLEKVGKDGYAFVDSELAPAVRAVAAPIRDHRGVVVAAINASLPPGVMTVEEIRASLVPDVVAAAQAISEDLAPDAD
jgi:IclR family pca regulon transcriptional regulator